MAVGRDCDPATPRTSHQAESTLLVAASTAMLLICAGPPRQGARSSCGWSGRRGRRRARSVGDVAVVRAGARAYLGPRSGFFFNDTATTEIYTLSLHDALPI